MINYSAYANRTQAKKKKEISVLTFEQFLGRFKVVSRYIKIRYIWKVPEWEISCIIII